MNSKPLKKPLLLRQIGCQSMTDCTYDIEHLYKRMQNNPSFTILFKEYIDEGRYKELCDVLKKDNRFEFLWK
jgi:hypothetical protein